MMNLNDLYLLIRKRKKSPPKNSYTAKLFKEGADRVIQKYGEESVELIIAAKGRDKQKIIEEAADVLFQYTMILVLSNITIDDVLMELTKRRSGRVKKNVQYD